MNRHLVYHLISKLLLIEAIFLCLPLIVALIYGEPSSHVFSFLITIAILCLIGGAGSLSKPKDHHLYTKEGMLIVALCWILWAFFGALPLVLSGQIPSLIDAFFEMSSGFTTTGATILPNVEILSHSMIFWRCFAHLIGGMGVLVFALSIMANSKNAHLEVMRAEMPGPIFGKLVSRLRDTAQILYIIYLAMALLFMLVLYLAGLPAYDAIVTGMSGAGTGGFAVYNDSIAHYDSALITNIVSFGVLFFGINFNLYYFLLLRKLKIFFLDEELHIYLGLTFLSSLVIALNTSHLYGNFLTSLQTSFFQVTNTLTTTGFGITDLTTWPLFSQVIIFFLMFLGGSAGSTAGGLKIMRAMILAKIGKNSALSSLYPNRILSLPINGSNINKETQHKVLKYFSLYMTALLIIVLLLSLDTDNFFIASSAAVSSFNNIGPILGTSESFAIFSPWAKLLLSLVMIAGRLEIYPVLLLFIPKTWSRY